MNRSSSSKLADSIVPEDFPRGSQWLGRLVLYYLMTRNHRNALRSERKLSIYRESAIEAMRQLLQSAANNGLPHVQKVSNLSLYLLLMDRDFAILKVDMVAATFDGRRMNFIARQMAVMIYEATDDLKEMLGKDFRSSLTVLKTPQADFEELNRIHSRICCFANDHEKLLNELRNVVAAHREKDAIQYLKVCESLEPSEIFELGGDFHDILNELIRLLTRITRRVGKNSANVTNVSPGDLCALR
jgi:hypothetical protein